GIPTGARRLTHLPSSGGATFSSAAADWYKARYGADSMTARPPCRASARWVLLALALPLLAGCGGGGSHPSQAAADAPAQPVEQLYNNGLDALNGQRYQTAEDQ